jgi:hypothetical protein
MSRVNGGGRNVYLYDDFGHRTYTTADDTYYVSVAGQTVRGALVLGLPAP